ncbi:MAG: hypothetical protein IJ091_02745 [Oscillospiraceae bacterium]|nr:hypothetical protein [Oscillospiraceae bacterium]
MIASILKETKELLARSGAVKRPEDQYSHMRYLKWLPIMRFDVERYDLEGYGTVMSMHTTTKMGMELLTLSFMPGEGLAVPYLLMDSMSMKSKKCVFVEYYGCGNDHLEEKKLREVWEQYRELPDYAEKPGWYIAEREPYSLIKSGTEEQLCDMAADSLKAYLLAVESATRDPEYPPQLKKFRERMIRDGNPSSKTLKMLLKKEGADRFMREVVMPLKD